MPLTSIHIPETIASKQYAYISNHYNYLPNATNNYNSNTILGNMPDWNPVEMIGYQPSELSYSLYEKLITNDAWNISRSQMGYKKVAKPLMYKMLSENNIKRGSSRQSLIAACIWNALKSKDLSRSTKEIAKLFNIDIKKMTIGCKEFNEKMHVKDVNYSTSIKPTTADNYIERYTVKLGIPLDYKDSIIKVANISEKLGIITNNTPQSVAAGSIYLISVEYKLGLSKKKLHEICEISEVTISKAYKELDKYKKYLL